MPRFDAHADPVPTAVRDLLALFEQQQLPPGGFPDVTPQSMLALMGDVEGHHSEVAEARAALEAAEQGLAARQAILLKHAQRGLRYAKVFADGDEALTERLDALGLAQGPRPERRTRKRRTKAPAVQEAVPELPLLEGTATASAEAEFEAAE